MAGYGKRGRKNGSGAAPLPRTFVSRIAIPSWDTWSGAGNPLGGPVSFTLSRRPTVLVGRNGSGKSAIFEATRLGAHCALGRSISYSAPDAFECDVSSKAATLRYKYASEIQFDADVGQPTGNEWTESCYNGKTRVWGVSSGVLKTSTSRSVLPVGIGLLQLDASQRKSNEAKALFDTFDGLRLVHSGVPRTRELRRPLTLRRDSSSSHLVVATTEDPRLGALALVLSGWDRDAPDLFAEFNAIGRRLGLFSDGVEVRHYAEPDDQDTRTSFADVEIDRANLGVLSDGTLRTCEIIEALINPRTSTLLIEEPETGVHPGLLRKLLAEFDAYAEERQIVVSTHNSMIVDWATPAGLRLVAREGGVTTVSEIAPADRERLSKYLDDDGSLSDFLFLRSE